MARARKCQEPGCTGTIAADGYCDTCGAKAPARRPATAAKAAAAPAAPPPAPAAVPPPPDTAPEIPATRGSLVTGSARSAGSRRATGPVSARSSRRTGIGAGLVDVPPAPAIDPASVVLENPVVAEDKRFCSQCGSPVGRARGSEPGRQSGFCPKCRNPFDFVPKLGAGAIVGGQYEVVGCLAHGGLGWIYLAKDKAVNDRWVVLKGLLDSGDKAAMAVAVAERRYLAGMQHPNIVGIFNFVTAGGSGYIVMEYVGGPSLKQLLKQRQQAAGGTVDPLPVEQAIAFILAILPAFSYLHGRGLLYCDFKPDNLIQVGDQVKLIDLGAVRRVDDVASDVYGTVGFQAPEIADIGPSVASDVYTIGRTLAVLTLDFRGYTTDHQHVLPDPVDHEVLARFGSFYRLLLKCTAPHPDDRFQSAAELSEQLVGVLREVVALTTGRPQPAPSVLFGPPPDEAGLPPLAVDPSDPAAAFLAALPADDPGAVLRDLESALNGGQLTATVEVRLRSARALIETGDLDRAATILDAVEQDDPWEWRAVWLRGVRALAAGDLAAAEAAFDRCRSEVPGELAPKLAAATVAERAGALDRAAPLYDLVVDVDPGYVAATRGLARCKAQAGDVAGALAAYDRIPKTHRARAGAQLDSVRTLTAAGHFAKAVERLAGLDLNPAEGAALEIELYTAALGAGLTGKGAFVPERDIRLRLERALRRLARFTADEAERHALVDRANAVRPLTLL